MPSSTFSSDRAEGAMSVTQLLLGVGVAVLLFAGLETYWRASGAMPSFVDSKPRWSYSREQVSKHTGVALLGNSRMQFGFSLDAFRARYPDVPVQQLAVASKRPIATLNDLANDEQFNGTVLMSFEADNLMPFRRYEQQPYVDHYQKRWKIDTRLNFYLGNLAERLFVTRHHPYSVDAVLRSVVDGNGIPQPVKYMNTKIDREINADYTMENVEKHRQRRIYDVRLLYEQMYPIPQAVWQRGLDEFLQMVQRINNRGGCVIIARFPSAGQLYNYEQKLFPKQQFWSVVASEPQLRAVHFEDLNIMDEIDMPDLQHVAMRDKRRFTDALLDYLATTKSVEYSRCKL